MEKVTKENKRNGEILLGFRKQNKITQSELGNMIGRDSRDISKYEKGFRAIPQSAVDLLNDKYHLKLKSTGKVYKVVSTTRNFVVEYSPKKSTKSVKTTKSAKKVKSSGVTTTTTTTKPKTFAERLIAVRESLGLTQKSFAKKYGFKLSRLEGLEKGRTTSVDVNSLSKLSKVTDIVSLVK